MTTIPPTTNAAPTSGGATGSSAGATSSGAVLGKDQFLKLLVGQLQHQDPLNPTSDQDFVGQMAQFTMVEQLTQMNAATEYVAGQNDRAHAVSLIGRNVTWVDNDDVAHEGVVERANTKDGLTTLTIGGVGGIYPWAVQEVR